MSENRKERIREKSLQILRNAGCDEESYEGFSKDVIEKDLRTAFEDGIDGFSYEEIAEDIYSLSNTERGWKEPVEYTPPGDAAHCGISDLYPDVRKKLEEIIESGVPFKTGGLNSKKEICGFTLFRKLINGPINITVWAAMDEDADLVSDAIPNSVPPDFLTYEDIDAIVRAMDDEWWQIGYASEAECSDTVPGDTNLDGILEKVSELLENADAQLTEAFEDVKSRVRNVIIEKGGERYLSDNTR